MRFCAVLGIRLGVRVDGSRFWSWLLKFDELGIEVLEFPPNPPVGSEEGREKLCVGMLGRLGIAGRAILLGLEN